MFEIEGDFSKAKVFAEQLEPSAMGQLKALCNQEFTKGSTIRIMPDAHAGAGCVVGTTMTIGDFVVPNLVGVDIGCGMHAVKLDKPRLDFPKLDKVIMQNVPTGFRCRKRPHRFLGNCRIDELTVAKAVVDEKARHSIGSLGGGNHFIEVARDEESGEHWLVVHSGSRHIGLSVATLHQKKATDSRAENVPAPLAPLSGQDMEDYLHDMVIMQEYADWNRRAIVDEILKGMGWDEADSFATIHNFIDPEDRVLRKGAVSARKGERLLIPMNMRDGSLICEGLGNEDWNCSGPHGAGRLYSRTEAKARLTLTNFKKEMEGIYSTRVLPSTLDESPEAYKPMESILAQIGDSVKITHRLKPVYNYKA